MDTVLKAIEYGLRLLQRNFEPRVYTLFPERDNMDAFPEHIRGRNASLMIWMEGLRRIHDDLPQGERWLEIQVRPQGAE